MAKRYLQTVLTPSVQATEDHYYGRHGTIGSAPEQDPLTDEERDFIQLRDSFYIATITENGWPYIQHRGGQPGFVRVLSPGEFAFADYRGNRQLLSTGNLSVNDRVALFFMDYPERLRLKILGHARVEDAREHPEPVVQLTEPEIRPLVERLFFIRVLSFDWNCSQHITPRYTAAKVEKVVAPLKERIAELESRQK